MNREFAIIQKGTGQAYGLLAVGDWQQLDYEGSPITDFMPGHVVSLTRSSLAEDASYNFPTLRSSVQGYNLDFQQLCLSLANYLANSPPTRMGRFQVT